MRGGLPPPPEPTGAAPCPRLCAHGCSAANAACLPGVWPLAPAGERPPAQQFPQSPGAGPPVSLPPDDASRGLSRFLAGGAVSRVTPPAEDTRKPAPHSLPASPQVPFPCADPALHPLAAVGRGRDDQVLGPVSPPSRGATRGDVPGADAGTCSEDKSTCLYSLKSDQIVRTPLDGQVPNASDSARVQPGAPAPRRAAGSHVGSFPGPPLSH